MNIKNTKKAISIAVISFGIIAATFYLLFNQAKNSDSTAKNIADDNRALSEIIMEAASQNAPTKFLYNRLDTQSMSADIYAGQLGDTLKIKDILFQLVVKPDANYSIDYPSNGKAPLWGGILSSVDNGLTWLPFFKTKDPISSESYNNWGTLVYNPVGLFVQGSNLYLDLVDGVGAGSGEGRLARLVSSDGGESWKTAGCYYFIPEQYFKYAAVDNPNTGYTEKQGINPQSLKTATGCAYKIK